MESWEIESGLGRSDKVYQHSDQVLLGTDRRSLLGTHVLGYRVPEVGYRRHS